MTGSPIKPDDQAMSLGEHLEELRRRLITALVGIAVVSGGTFLIGREVVAWLCVPLLAAQRNAHVAVGVFSLSPSQAFAVYMKVSLVAALVIASPFVLFQVWRFIEAGLYTTERRAVMLVTPFSAALTAVAVAFMYYVMLPVSLWFLITFSTSYPPLGSTPSPPIPVQASPSQSTDPASNIDNATAPTTPPLGAVPVLSRDPHEPMEGQLWFKVPQRELRIHAVGRTRTIPLASNSLVNPLIEIDQYINFVAVMTVGTVAAFQLPVIMLLLGWSGLIAPERLARYRKHCVFTCFAVGMILTPSDVLSMILLSLPLWGLFELGLVAMRFAYRGEATPG